MLANFKKRVCAQEHIDVDLDDETIHVTGPSTPMPSETNNNVAQARPHPQSDPCSLLPSSRSIIQVSYPPSYLGIHISLPDPPPYPIQEDDPGNSPLTFSSTTGIQETHDSPDPLAEDSSLTGIPFQGACSSIPLTEPNLPTIDFVNDLDSEDTELLPPYSHFDQRRPRFPIASDVLGAHPSLSICHQAMH